MNKVSGWVIDIELRGGTREVVRGWLKLGGKEREGKAEKCYTLEEEGGRESRVVEEGGVGHEVGGGQA